MSCENFSIEEIQNLLAEMRPLALKALKNKEGAWDCVSDFVKPQEALEYLLSALRRLKNTEYAKIIEVRTQRNMTDEMWDNYEFMFDSDVLAEQKQLTKANKEFRLQWTFVKKEYGTLCNAAKKDEETDT